MYSHFHCVLVLFRSRSCPYKDPFTEYEYFFVHATFRDWFSKKHKLKHPHRTQSLQVKAMDAKTPEGSSAQPLPKRRKTENSKKRKKANLTLDFSKLKPGRTQSTLDRWLFKPKTPTRVRFKEQVLMKEIIGPSVSWTTVALKGFSHRNSTFAKKRARSKQVMAHTHRLRRQRLTPKNARRIIHILERMRRENTKLGY